MGRMKDVAMDVEKFLNAGMSEKDIAAKTGMPIEQIKDYAKESKELEKDVKVARRLEKEDLGKMGLQRTPNRSGGRGSAGGGGMNPTDIEKVPGKRQLKMKAGGKVSASKRADGCAIRGKTKGKMK